MSRLFFYLFISFSSLTLLSPEIIEAEIIKIAPITKFNDSSSILSITDNVPDRTAERGVNKVTNIGLSFVSALFLSVQQMPTVSKPKSAAGISLSGFSENLIGSSGWPFKVIKFNAIINEIDIIKYKII